MTHRRRLAWALACVAALAVTAARPKVAHAWQESHEAYAEVTVTVDPDGVAHFEQAISYRVVRGPLRSFDLEGVEKNAVPDKEARITAPDGRDLSAQVEMTADHTLRVSVDEPRALMRGTFVFHVKYTVDLVAAGELARDGAMWRLNWSAPVATEGFDGGKVVFALPPAPTEPRAVNAATGNGDESILSSLRRAPDHDELELVRPHVARGEAAAWSIRLDPKAFPLVKAPELRPAPPPPPPPPDRVRDVAVLVGLAAFACLFGLLALHKERAFAAACRRYEGSARGDAAPSVDSAAAKPTASVRHGLLPVAPSVRAGLAGASIAGAIALEMAGMPTLGALAVAATMVLASLRAPDLRPSARGPGRWLAVLPDDAFASANTALSTHWLDIGARAGKAVAFVALLLVLGAAFVARKLDAEAPFLIALDAAALLPIFFTGRVTQLPPDLARRPVRRLRALYRRLLHGKKRDALRVVPWARVPSGLTEADELRLLALPRVALPGLLGIEVGAAWSRTPSGYDGDLEVLVRVQESTSAAARITALAPGARPVPGRREGERVIRLVPRVSATALVERLARELTDRRRRIPERSWEGAERRGV